MDSSCSGERAGLEPLCVILLGYWGKFTVTSKSVLPMRELHKYLRKIFRELICPWRRVIARGLSYLYQRSIFSPGSEKMYEGLHEPGDGKETVQPVRERQ